MTVLLVVLSTISLAAAILVAGACILSGQVSQIGRMPIGDTDCGEIGREREAENAVSR